MTRRKWGATTKAMIVMEGLKGKPVAEICGERRISQSLYYQWRMQFSARAAKAFESRQYSRKEALLERENTRLKRRVRELLLELRKFKKKG